MAQPKLDEVSNAEAVRLFSFFGSIIAGSGVAASIFVMFVVYAKSPPIMNKFKFYLLAYTFSCFLVELVFLLYKPVILRSHLIVYPVGIWSSPSAVVQKWLLIFMFVGVGGVFVTFLMMFIERLFALTANGIFVPFYKRPSTYWWILSVFFVAIVAPWIVGSFWLPAFLEQSEIPEMIPDSGFLRESQPEFLVIRKSHFWIFLYSTTIDCTIFAVVLAIIFVLYLKKFRQSVTVLSRKTRAGHVMLFRCMIFQLLAIFCLVFCSSTLNFVVFIFHLPDYLLLMPFMLAWTFPLIDNLVILFTIKPYRKYVFQFYYRQKEKTSQLVPIQESEGQCSVYSDASWHHSCFHELSVIYRILSS